MPEKTDRNEKLVGFCSAPWTDCITYADGALKACDRNVTSFGNWQEGGLKQTWNSEKFQAFRKAVAEGRYPDTDCASCHNNGTQRTAESSLRGSFVNHYEALRRILRESDFPRLNQLWPVFEKRTRSAETDAALQDYFTFLDELLARYAQASSENKELQLAFVKLRVIGESLQDYLAGELKPRRVASFRQSQLQAKCTARCVMCAGKYTGEIVDGPTMDEKYVDEAFAEPEDIVDFWCNGAEYLYYKEWRKIALMLADQGVKLRISTNGILLTEPTIRFMIDNKILRFLTVSLDAATKETMESTRINVNFHKNMDRVRYLMAYAHEQGHYFEFTAAFVMMKRNLVELPAFIRLIGGLRPPGCKLLVTILCQPLENFDIPNYRRFVHGEHHVLLGEKHLREIFLEAHKAEQETGVTVTFYNQKLGDFIAAGMPFPKYFPRRSDVDLILADLSRPEARIPYLEKPLSEKLTALTPKFGGDRAGLLAELQRAAIAITSQNEVWAEIGLAHSDFTEKARQLLPSWCEAFLQRSLPAADVTTETITDDSSLIRVESEETLSMVLKEESGAIILEPSSRNTGPLKQAFLIGLSYLYVGIHRLKTKLVGNRKSLLLWRMSVVYRNALAMLGLRVQALPKGTETSQS